jgi:hypothetical protein
MAVTEQLSAAGKEQLRTWILERLLPLLDNDPAPSEFLSNYVVILVETAVEDAADLGERLTAKVTFQGRLNRIPSAVIRAMRPIHVEVWLCSEQDSVKLRGYTGETAAQDAAADASSA